MNLRTAAAAFGATLAFAAPAIAQTGSAQGRPSQSQADREAALAAQVQALQEQLTAIQSQLQDLKEGEAADAADVRRIQTAAPTVSVANGRPTFSTADNQFRFAVRSVVQYDVAHYDQDAPKTPDNRRSDASNPSDLNSGSNFRRARLGVEGTAFRNWNYAIMGEFGGSGSESPVLNQAYIEYVGWKPWASAAPLRLRVGAWATPTSLEDATPNTDGLFLERPAAAELVRNIAGGDGRDGFGVLANGDRWYADAVLTGSTVGNTGEFDEQTGYLTRIAFLPLKGQNYAVHVGASVQGVIDPADTNAGSADTKVIRLRERPELRVDGERFADTGSIPSDGVIAYGAELGGYWHNFYGAAEAFQIDLSRRDGITDPHFGGWYVQGAWTLTGESHRWAGANGGFAGVRPTNAFDLAAHHWGAWEIAARYSALDLNYKEGALGTAPLASAVRGGDQTITTLGLNWYPNNTVRFLLDYLWVDVDRYDPEVTSTIVTAVPGFGAQIGQSYQAIALRSQFAF